MDPLLGTIILFAGNFAPQGWAFCHGQELAIQQYTALFAVIGTTYGGNGSTTFALPDLRGRVPVGQGHGPNLSNYELGKAGGAESVSLVGTVGAAKGDLSALSASGAAHNNMQPYLGLNYIIAHQGVFPSRD